MFLRLSPLRPLVSLLVAALMLCGALHGAEVDNRSEADKKVVNFQADIMRPVRIYGDSSALNLLGNVVFYHNGAVITCDSAVRYNDRRMDCFKNVVINKGTLYAYGDRAEYNGEINTANLYAPIIKMVDKDAVMYTFTFSFNTKSSVAHFGMGATIKQKENLLESDHGYYRSNERTLICVERVEIEDVDYSMKSDSVEYDLNEEIGRFYRRGVIWNSKGEILSAEQGVRYNKQDRYRFVADSYILSDKQETWADTIDYRALQDQANLRNNIQLIDQEHGVIGFGDHGDYWGEDQRALLTRNPSLISYEAEQDTLYVRADSMFLYSMDRKLALLQDSVAKAAVRGVEPQEELIEEVTEQAQPSLSQAQTAQSVPNPNEPLSQDGIQVGVLEPDSVSGDVTLPDSVVVGGDSTMMALADSTKTALTLPDSTQQAMALADSTKIGALKGGVEVEPQRQDSLVRIMRGYRNVKIFRTDFQAVCDSLVGFSIDSTIHLHIEPVLWSGSSQITAKLIDVYTENKELRNAKFIGEPIMSSQVDSSRYNQVKGKEMEALFANNEIYRNDVNGNGETYYYMQDESSGAIQGFLVAECANIAFMITQNQIDKIIYKGSPVYSIYPLEKIPQDQPQIMVGFRWEAKRRPELKDVFDRTIRPSQSEHYRALPKPTFPLTMSIMQRKAQMISSGQWRERNESLSEDAIDFIRSIINK